MSIETVATPVIRPAVDFPTDPHLDELASLFDAGWIWERYQSEFGQQERTAETIRLRQFAHSIGRTAMASYLLEWPHEDYLPSQHLTVKTDRGSSAELFRYPDDDRLPGLSDAADPDSALALINRHVLEFRARRVRVQLIRYRPRSRAVFRHRVGKIKLYARVVRPEAASRIIEAYDLIAQSEFVVPRIVGHWQDGGILWLSEIPGKNLRQRIIRGETPDPTPLLEGLESLWTATSVPVEGRPFNLPGAYRTARRMFKNKIRYDDPAAWQFNDAVAILDPFVKSWEPNQIAHNDFYDDQMLRLPDGRVALVDFEEAGPGDPMLDVGNCLAHLKWSEHFSRRKKNASGKFYNEFKTAAIDRFQWHPQDLEMREAVCIFRICTNTIRRPQSNWRDNLHQGLQMVNQTLA